jgi:hypothetical protein
MKRLHLISGPRNISTALMYSFGNRSDTTVIDEPMYAHYLVNHPDIDHPGREEIIDSQSININEIISQLSNEPHDSDVLFIKNMAHHLKSLDWSFLLGMTNIFLIRDPRQLIASFAQVISSPTLLDIGIKVEYEIFEYLRSKDQKCIVLDSNEVLKDPKKVLKQLCDEIGIDFESNMLHWSAGPRKEDGIWAKYWYDNVHRSTGFAKQSTSSRAFPEELLPLLQKALKYYDLLCAYSLKA